MHIHGHGLGRAALAALLASAPLVNAPAAADWPQLWGPTVSGAVDAGGPETLSIVCGAPFSGLSSFDIRPSSTSRISSRIAIIASQKRSSSACDSLSVGSTIKVPAIGNDIVGAWKP